MRDAPDLCEEIMPKPKQLLEWKVALSDREWNRSESLEDLLDHPTAQHAPQGHRRTLLLWAALALLLAISASAYLLWRKAQSGLELLHQDLALVVEAESWPARTVEIGDMSLNGEVAMVEVTTKGAEGKAFRQTRFYRYDQAVGWQRISPDVSLWGPAQSMETTHIRWSYHALDAPAVTQVAEQIDQRYAQLRRELGLLPAPAEKFTVEIRAAATNWPTPQFRENWLVTASPLLVVAPADVSRSELLQAAVLPVILRHALEVAEAEMPVWCVWRSLLEGYVQWQLHASHAPTTDALTTTNQAHLLPANPSLMKLLGSQQTCLDRPVTQLSYEPSDPATTALAESLFVYIAEEHGREHIPAFLAVLRRYSTWDDAIPAAFAISAAEFEAGWQAHLARQHPPLQ